MTLKRGAVRNKLLSLILCVSMLVSLVMPMYAATDDGGSSSPGGSTSTVSGDVYGGSDEGSGTEEQPGPGEQPAVNEPTEPTADDEGPSSPGGNTSTVSSDVYGGSDEGSGTDKQPGPGEQPAVDEPTEPTVDDGGLSSPGGSTSTVSGDVYDGSDTVSGDVYGGSDEGAGTDEQPGPGEQPAVDEPAEPTADALVQAMIDALPDPETIDGPDEALLGQWLTIWDAYNELTEEEQALVDTTRLEELRLILFGAPMMLTAEEVPWEGSGTSDDPYLIADSSGLAALATSVNAGNVDYSAAHFKLTADITLMDTWTPIGTKDAPFAGTFDGNGATVSGLNISNDSADYQALFGYTTADAVIRDMTVSGAVTGGNYCALVVAYNEGELNNVTAQGMVTGNTKASNTYFAGVAAYNTGTMTDCVNQGEVVLTVEHTNAYAGGVTAYTAGVLSECVNEAAIKTEGTVEVSSGSVYTAGVAANGTTDSSFEGCTNRGDITTNTKMRYLYLGGVTAYTRGALMLNCSNSGVLTAGTETGNTPKVYLGGLAGYVSNNGLQVLYCSNTGSVTATTATGTCYAGGLVGQVNGNTPKIMYCYNQGAVHAGITQYVAGLLGDVSGTLTAVTGCYTAGTVGQTICGNTNGIYHDTYYLADTSGAEMNKGGYPRTEEEMKSPDFIAQLGYAFLAVDGEFPALQREAGPAGNDTVVFCYNESSLKALGIETFDQFDSTVTVVRNADGTVTSPPVKAKEYYEFVGWYADGDCTGEPVDLTQPVEAGMILYAKWKVADIQVFYRMNDGTEENFLTVTVPYNQVTKQPVNSPMRTGFSFTEWYTDAECTTLYDFNKKVTGVLTLYAGWETGLDAGYFNWYTAAPENETFTISNGNELRALADLVNGTAPGEIGVIEPVSFANKTITINAGGYAAIDLSGVTFTKLIGNRIVTPFQGILKGSCVNLNINNAGVDNQALFGYAVDAAFQDLNIAGTVTGGNYTAGLVLRAENTVFKNITAAVNVTGTNYVGGVVAYATGGFFQNVYIGAAGTEGQPVVTPAVSGNGYVGGMVGNLAAGGNMTFTSCVSFAAVTGGAAGYTGGLAGRVDCSGEGIRTFTKCENKGTVSGSKYVGGVLGGAVAGAQPVKFDRCKNGGTITGGQFVGGIAGTVGLAVTDTAQGIFLSCKNEDPVSGTDSVGGILGSAFSAAVKKTVLNSCQNDGPLDNTGAKTGGLVGQAMQAEITDSRNTGTVTITGSDGTVGGLAGDLNNTTVFGCQNEGAVSTNTGNTVGGLVGTMLYSRVKDSSNTAAVSTNGGIVGGLVGSSNGSSITNCFNTGNVTGGQQAAGIVYTMTFSQVSNCYNIGQVGVVSALDTAVASGIAGNQTDKISYVKSCYTYGNVKASKTYAISGGTTPAIVNCYYLDTAVASPLDGDKITAKTEEEFKGHALAYRLDGGGSANRTLVWTGGEDYPVFATEENPCVYKITLSIIGGGMVSLKPDAEYVAPGTEVTLTVIPEGENSVTLLTVKDSSGVEVKLTDGKFTAEAKDYRINTVFGVIDPTKEYTITFHSNGGSAVEP